MMTERLRQFLLPTPTTPTDSFKWSDKRPIRDQIASGLRKAVVLILGYGVLVGGLGSLIVLSDRTATRGLGQFVLWCCILLATAGIMFMTANRWSPYVAGFFFGPAILHVCFVLFFGSDSYYSTNSFSQLDAAEFLVFAIAVVALTVRFVGERPAPTTLIDRLALTFFAMAMFRQMVIPYRFPPFPLMSGVGALLIAWIAFRLGPQATARRRRHRRT
jgi:hypothetical protein